MKKLKSIVALLICIAMLSALPALYASAYDREIYVNEPASYASALGITEDALTQLVDYLYTAVELCQRDISISRFGIKLGNGNANVAILRDLMMENPKSFNVKGIQYSVSGQNIVGFKLTYRVELAEFRDQIAECNAVADELTEGLSPNMPEMIKALIIHDRLVAHCRYSMDYHEDTGRYDEDDYNAYGALVGGKAVCQGYTNAYAYMLNYVGISNYSCPSDELAHIWNIVILDGVKYHVDVTWDDPLLDVPGRVGHWNLLLSSDALYYSYPDKHIAYDYDTSPVSTDYDGFFWQDSQAQFCLLNGTIYYIDHTTKTLCSYDYVTNTSQVLLDLSNDYWPASGNSYWTSSYARLATYKGILFYSRPDGVYSFDPVTLVSEPFFLPDMSAHNCFSVFGFNVINGVMTCLGAATPNLRQTTEIEYYTLMLEPGNEYEEPVVTGVEQGGVYEGEVAISWTVGEGTLDGSPFDNGGSLSAPGEHTLAVVNGDKAVTLTFTILQATPPANRKGDIDGDGAITVTDALSVLRVAARLAPATPELLAYGDVDGDGAITVADALLILRVAAKLVPSL